MKLTGFYIGDKYKKLFKIITYAGALYISKGSMEIFCKTDAYYQSANVITWLMDATGEDISGSVRPYLHNYIEWKMDIFNNYTPLKYY